MLATLFKAPMAFAESVALAAEKETTAIIREWDIAASQPRGGY